MESQPQNPEFRNSPESFHPMYNAKSTDISCAGSYKNRRNVLLSISMDRKPTFKVVDLSIFD